MKKAHLRVFRDRKSFLQKSYNACSCIPFSTASFAIEIMVKTSDLLNGIS